jgi:hypothetical protein
MASFSGEKKQRNLRKPGPERQNGIATIRVKIATSLGRKLPIVHVFFERISTLEVGDDIKLSNRDALRARNICVPIHDGKQRPNASSNLGDP